MAQYGFFFDASRCTGCKTCVIACKDAKGLPVGINFRHVTEVTSGTWEKTEEGCWTQNVKAYYVSIACNHCEKPACVAVCPTKAHYKDTKTGLVLINADKCIGCEACAKACPYGAPVLDEKAKKMRKCDACAERLGKGGKPVCVEACTMRALDFGSIDAFRKKYGSRADIRPLPSPAITKPALVALAPKNYR